MPAEDGNGENPNPGETWELARLIGRYETFAEGIERRLEKIEGHLETGSETFSHIKLTIASKTEQIDNIDARLKKVEKDGSAELSKRRRLQIDGTTMTAIVLGLKELFAFILDLIH